MKILQVNKFFYPRGGADKYFLELSKLLEKNGHEVIYFSTKNQNNLASIYDKYFAEEVDLDKFNVKNIIKIFYNYDAAKKLEKLIIDTKPDIAHLHNIYHQLSPGIIKVLKKYNIPAVMTLHDYKLICPNYQLFSNNKYCKSCIKNKYYNCLIKKCVKNSYLKSFLAMLEAYLNNKIYQKIDYLIAPSKFIKNKFVEFGHPKAKIRQVYNFFVQPKNKLKIIKNQNYLLYFGRLAPEKGVEILIKAFKELNNKNIKLKIAGTGDLIKNYQLIIKNLGLQDKVELLGYKSGADLQKIIEEAKAVVIPSIWPENMPLAMLEAMAAGKAVIASKIGGMPEIIENKKNGFLFEAGNTQELANIIDNLEQFDLEKIGQKAEETAAKLNKDSHYQQIIRLYQKVLTKKI